jgi:hypothetical protein
MLTPVTTPGKVTKTVYISLTIVIAKYIMTTGLIKIVLFILLIVEYKTTFYLMRASI